MEDYGKLKLEFEIQAQKVIHQFMITNKDYQNQIKSGIEKAFKEIDVESLVKQAVHRTITSAISDATSWGTINDQIRNKLSSLIMKESVAIYEKLEDFLNKNK